MDIVERLRRPTMGHCDLMYEAATENELLRTQLAECQRELESVESLRPHWAKGYSSDSIAAQASSAALSQLWKLLGVSDQTAATQKVDELRQQLATASQQLDIAVKALIRIEMVTGATACNAKWINLHCSEALAAIRAQEGK